MDISGTKNKKDNSLYDTLLAMHFSNKLLTSVIADIKIELKELQRNKRSIEKKLALGQKEYVSINGREANFKRR